MRTTPSLAAALALSLLLPSLAAAAPPPSAEAPAGQPAYCFAVYGDSREGDADHRRVVQAILAGRPAAVFHAGDMVSDGDDAGEWARFNDATGELRQKAEFFPTLGNHEKGAERYFSNFGLPKEYRWYSVSRGGVHVAVLDSGSDLSPGSPQHAWLEKDLAQADTPFVAVLLHAPPFSSGAHGDDGALQRDLVPLLERSGVDLVFSGHDHDYERLEVNGIRYVVTGGGGAPPTGEKARHKASRAFFGEFHFVRACVERGGMTVEARTPEGKTLDRFVVPLKVRPAQPRPDRPVNCCGHF